MFRLRALALPIDEDADGALSLGADCEVDVAAFRAAYAAGDDARALALATAPALEGLDGLAGEAFDLWLHEQRGMLLRQRQHSRLNLAARHAVAGNADAALGLWQQILDEDASQETALAAAMALLARRGGTVDARAAAKAQRLLGERRVPALEAAQLRAALATR